MKNLSKENFWNKLYKKYPDGVQVFCDWIDKYKSKNNWDKLFNAGLMVPIRGQSVSPKYHDLPLAMQIGIWIEFVCDRGGCQWEIEDLFAVDWREDITGYIKMLDAEKKIDNEFDQKGTSKKSTKGTKI